MPATQDPVAEHEPLSADAIQLSEEKKAFCAKPWIKQGVKQPHIAVFNYACQSTPRPSDPKETIAYGAMNLNKLHDHEPEAIIKAIEAVDPNWFDTYPRKPGTNFDMNFKKKVVSELARTFFRYGLNAYGKPGLRTGNSSNGSSTPLAGL